MSLVSTLNDQEREDILQTSSKTVTKTRVRKNGVYQTSGEPLSKEALYRAKLKYGFYESPATKVSTGVVEPKIASDIAANYANDNKVTITAYKRMFVDPNAAHAATKVGVKGLEPVKTIAPPKSNEGSQSAATRAYSIVSTESTTSKVTKASAATSRSRAHSLSSATHAYNAKAVSSQQEKVNPKPKPLNMAKVLSGAERQAEKRIHERTTPTRQNFSYGLKTGGAGRAAGNSVQITKETLQKISAKIDSSVIEKEADPLRLAEYAAFAVRDVDPKTLMGAEYQENERKRAEYLKLLTSQNVLAKARENAEKELKLIDSMDNNKLLFGNEKYNEAALEHIRKNNEKKLPYQNKINMGGGLWLAPEEIDRIAQNMVSPVLGEVSERADNQRATDLDIEERTEAYKVGYAAWIAMQTAKLANNVAYVQNSQSRIAKERQSVEDKATNRFASLIRKNDEKYVDMTTELEETKESHSNLERELEELLESKSKENELALVNFGESIEADLADARKEQEELLKPYHDAVAEAEAEHERLVEEKEAINTEIGKLHKSIDNHNTMILKYERGIVAYDEQHENERENLSTLGQVKDGLNEDLNDNVVILAQKAKEQAEKSTEEARLKQLEVERMVNERKSELNATEIELKKEQLNMLEAMRDVAQARGDEKLDEARVKALLGMSYDDFIKQQKDLQAAKAAKSLDTPISGDIDEEDEVDEDLAKNAAESKIIDGSAKSVKGASGVIPAEETKASDDPSWSEKFFIGSENAKKRKGEPEPAVKPQSLSDKEQEKNTLEPTFSGFSQGSVPDDQPVVKEATQESEDIPYSSGTEDNNKNSYFKEVF